MPEKKKSSKQMKATRSVQKSSTTKKRREKNEDLAGHYQVIRKDILKLRTDLQKGYDLAKVAVEKKNFLGKFLRIK